MQLQHWASKLSVFIWAQVTVALLTGLYSFVSGIIDCIILVLRSRETVRGGREVHTTTGTWNRTSMTAFDTSAIHNTILSKRTWHVLDDSSVYSCAIDGCLWAVSHDLPSRFPGHISRIPERRLTRRLTRHVGVRDVGSSSGGSSEHTPPTDRLPTGARRYLVISVSCSALSCMGLRLT